MTKKLYLLCGFLLPALLLMAGNPDRQGESGAAQLLLNPYAPSAGLHSLTTSMVYGVEAMRLNPAGLGRLPGKTQVQVGHALYLQGTDIALNALGFAQKIGENGTFGLSLMSVDFGDIAVTTVNQPEGTGTFLELSFFNLGLGYSHNFEDKIFVGILLRGISESTTNISAFGMALDAGIQYVSGEHKEFKFGISLRNVGNRMSYAGQGLATSGPAPDESNYSLTYNQRAAEFEMPSQLNIGLSLDLLTGLEKHRVTLVGNFTGSPFSRDQIGAGIEYSFNEIFSLRGGYRTDMNSDNVVIQESLYSGPSAGASIQVPLSKGNNTAFSIDYGYRATRVFDGTHNIGIRLDI